MTTGAYAQIHASSASDPAAFWSKAAEVVDWIKKPTTVLDDSRPPFYRWFADGTLNTCYNALDRHVAAGRADQVAVFYESPVTGQSAQFTYCLLYTSRCV